MTSTPSHLLKVQRVSQETDVVLVAAGEVEEDGQPGVVLQVTVNVEVEEWSTIDPEDACDKGAKVHSPCGVWRQVPSEIVQEGEHCKRRDDSVDDGDVENKSAVNTEEISDEGNQD